MQSTMSCILGIAVFIRMNTHIENECVIGLETWASSHAFHCSTPLYSTSTHVTYTDVEYAYVHHLCMHVCISSLCMFSNIRNVFSDDVMYMYVT